MVSFRITQGSSGRTFIDIGITNEELTTLTETGSLDLGTESLALSELHVELLYGKDASKLQHRLEQTGLQFAE